MIASALADLHAPLEPILRYVLATMPLPRAGVALDLACGPGLKLPLLVKACGPGVRFVALDRDVAAVRAARAGWPFAAGSCDAAWIAGDALSLPLRDSCCAAVFSIAALGLFSNPVAALREMRRVLRQDGTVLLVGATQMGAMVTRWPAGLGGRLCDAYERALGEGRQRQSAPPDLGADLARLLEQAGFAAPHIRAFLLDDTPPLAELSLLSWERLRPVVSGYLAAGDLRRCDTIAAAAEADICTLVLAARCGLA